MRMIPQVGGDGTGRGVRRARTCEDAAGRRPGGDPMPCARAAVRTPGRPPPDQYPRYWRLYGSSYVAGAGRGVAGRIASYPVPGAGRWGWAPG